MLGEAASLRVQGAARSCGGIQDVVDCTFGVPPGRIAPKNITHIAHVCSKTPREPVATPDLLAA